MRKSLRLTLPRDVFRWPAIHQGIHRQLLGHFVTTLLMPGIPKLLWGEEQEYYVLDSTNANYIFGRQPMSAATAWQMHGCYSLGSTQYFNMPLEAAKTGCNDDAVSNDHRDPSAPVRNILRRMYHLRESYPVLKDGFFLQQLSNQTWEIVLEGSTGVPTETGIWSVVRSEFAGVQKLEYANDTTTQTIYPFREVFDNRTMRWNVTRGVNDTSVNVTVPVAHDRPPADLPIWLIYTNVNDSRTFHFDCSNNDTALNTTALVSPFASGTTVKNLFEPFDEHLLIDSQVTLGINGSTKRNGCLKALEVNPYDFRAYVPKQHWVGPQPVITKFAPGHDARIVSSTTSDGTENLLIEIQFSAAMDCDSVSNGISLQSKTESGLVPRVLNGTVQCSAIENGANSSLVGGIPSKWSWSATLTDVANGVHRVTVNNVTTIDGLKSTKAKDHFLFRIGQADNPIVFPLTANYSSTLLTQNDAGSLVLNHAAAGADLYRYSTNFGTSFSEWTAYGGGSQAIEKQSWSGTSAQKWDGDHVRVEYFSRFAGSSAHVQQADLHTKARRFPMMHLNGPYNSYGFDAGLDNKFKLKNDNEWSIHWQTEWSKSGSIGQINVWVSQAERDSYGVFAYRKPSRRARPLSL